jgi:hypothetical protein
MNIEIEASARRIALECGAISLRSLVSWADEIIRISDNPDDRLFDVSLAKTTNNALEALNQFRDNSDRSSVSKVAMALMHDALKLGEADYQKVAKKLYFMAQSGYYPDDEAERVMWSFWDELDLAIDVIYGNPDEIRSKILQFLNDKMSCPPISVDGR